MQPLSRATIKTEPPRVNTASHGLASPSQVQADPHSSSAPLSERRKRSLSPPGSGSDADDPSYAASGSQGAASDDDLADLCDLQPDSAPRAAAGPQLEPPDSTAVAAAAPAAAAAAAAGELVLVPCRQRLDKWPRLSLKLFPDLRAGSCVAASVYVCPRSSVWDAGTYTAAAGAQAGADAQEQQQSEHESSSLGPFPVQLKHFSGDLFTSGLQDVTQLKPYQGVGGADAQAWDVVLQEKVDASTLRLHIKPAASCADNPPPGRKPAAGLPAPASAVPSSSIGKKKPPSAAPRRVALPGSITCVAVKSKLCCASKTGGSTHLPPGLVMSQFPGAAFPLDVQLSVVETPAGANPGDALLEAHSSSPGNTSSPSSAADPALWPEAKIRTRQRQRSTTGSRTEFYLAFHVTPRTQQFVGRRIAHISAAPPDSITLHLVPAQHDSDASLENQGAAQQTQGAAAAGASSDDRSEENKRRKASQQSAAAADDDGVGGGGGDAAAAPAPDAAAAGDMGAASSRGWAAPAQGGAAAAGMAALDDGPAHEHADLSDDDDSSLPGEGAGAVCAGWTAAAAAGMPAGHQRGGGDKGSTAGPRQAPTTQQEQQFVKQEGQLGMAALERAALSSPQQQGGMPPPPSRYGAAAAGTFAGLTSAQLRDPRRRIMALAGQSATLPAAAAATPAAAAAAAALALAAAAPAAAAAASAMPSTALGPQAAAAPAAAPRSVDLQLQLAAASSPLQMEQQLQGLIRSLRGVLPGEQYQSLLGRLQALLRPLRQQQQQQQQQQQVLGQAGTSLAGGFSSVQWQGLLLDYGYLQEAVDGCGDLQAVLGALHTLLGVQ